MVALVLDKMRAGKPKPEGGADGYSAAADEILSAVKAGDAGALATALKSFVGMCGNDEAGEPDEAE